MAESVGSISNVPIRDPERHGKSSRYVVDGRLSHAERLEIISRIAGGRGERMLGMDRSDAGAAM